MSKHRFTVNFGKREVVGNLNIENFPGNCGYKVVKYVRIEGGGRKLTPRQKEFIADSIRHSLHTKFSRQGYEKLIISARLDTKRIFDTIDFINQNNLLVGTVVKGTHGTGKTICAEYDLSTEIKKAINHKVKPLTGATFSMREVNNGLW